jgi:hypothetical protein
MHTVPVENVAGMVNCCLYLRFPSTHPWPLIAWQVDRTKWTFSSLFFITLGLELSDTKVYEP